MRYSGNWLVGIETREPGAIGIFEWTITAVWAKDGAEAREKARERIGDKETRGIEVTPISHKNRKPRDSEAG